MRLFLLLIIPLFTFSCSSKKFEKQMVSEDGKVKLILTAIQRVPLDPYTTVIHVEGYGHNESLPFELYNSEYLFKSNAIKTISDSILFLFSST